jgi:hypothetical protein
MFVTLIELILLAGAGVLILLSRKASERGQPDTFRAIEGAFARLARHRRLTVLLVGVSVIVLRIALIPLLGVPQPYAHDEFGYLLAADTFAHGKITNPTHPMWIHFEGFHIIQKPTYMSMYPPAQGLVLAAGEILGLPWIGQILATALMCSTLCWMLQGWLPPPWALFGAALAVLRLGILSYWMNGYWSASIVALGGALVLGAWPRLRAHLRIRDALLVVVGLAILANSRPFEGLVFAIPIAFAMLFWLLGKNRPAFGRTLPRVIAPILLGLLVASVATGYYYYRVTGNPFRMTYQLNSDTYGGAPFFIWQTPRPAMSLHHEVMEIFYRSELGEFKKNRTFAGYAHFLVVKLFFWWQFYLGPLLTVPLFAFGGVVRQKKMRLPLLICAVMIPALAVETWTMPHYFSPATGALYLLLVQGIRHLRHWSPAHRPLGREIVRAIPTLACCMTFIRVAAVGAHVPIEAPWPRGDLQRSAIVRHLKEQPGSQLVIVRYGPHHDPAREWVYNRADIDDAKLVWARDMGRDKNQELIEYFRGRNVWLVEPDISPAQAVAYPD